MTISFHKADDAVTPRANNTVPKQKTPPPRKVATPQGSGNPAEKKRLKGKTADPDKDKQIELLRKVWCCSFFLLNLHDNCLNEIFSSSKWCT